MLMLLLVLLVTEAASGSVSRHLRSEEVLSPPPPRPSTASSPGLSSLLWQYVSPVCWKDSYDRGIGVPISECDASSDHPDGPDAGLCYPKCPEPSLLEPYASPGQPPPEMVGVGPACWQACREGYIDDGATCRKDARIVGKPRYDRGAGRAWKIGSRAFECNSRADGYSVYNGGLCYLPCAAVGPAATEYGAPYVGIGTICWADCPPGTIEDGATCRVDAHIYGKYSVGRGVGTPMTCTPEQQYDAGLCYTPCPEDMVGIGPLCWDKCYGKRPAEFGPQCCAKEEHCDYAAVPLYNLAIPVCSEIAYGFFPEPFYDIARGIMLFAFYLNIGAIGSILHHVKEIVLTIFRNLLTTWPFLVMSS